MGGWQETNLSLRPAKQESRPSPPSTGSRGHQSADKTSTTPSAHSAPHLCQTVTVGVAEDVHNDIGPQGQLFGGASSLLSEQQQSTATIHSQLRLCPAI